MVTAKWIDPVRRGLYSYHADAARGQSVTTTPTHLTRLALLAALALASAGCCGLAAKVAARALTSGGDAYATDDDPELVRDAVPFGLKTMEGVLESRAAERGAPPEL